VSAKKLLQHVIQWLRQERAAPDAVDSTTGVVRRDKLARVLIQEEERVLIGIETAYFIGSS
jgi:hypothetical protein